MKGLLIGYMILSFAFLVACFVWLAATNAGNPKSPQGGTVVDFLPPAEWIKIGSGQFLAVLGFYFLATEPSAYVLGKWVSGEDGSGKFRVTIAYLTPLAIGCALVVWGIVGLVRWYSR